MSRFALSEIKNPKLEGWNAPERFREYALKVDGVVSGRLAHKYRPKNAGGPSWCVTWTGNHGMPTSFYGSKAQCLEFFKTQF